jgi:hypothetical protein
MKSLCNPGRWLADTAIFRRVSGRFVRQQGSIRTNIQALQRLNDLLWGSGVCVEAPMWPLSESFPFPKLVVSFAKDKLHLCGCPLAEKLGLIGLCGSGLGVKDLICRMGLIKK